MSENVWECKRMHELAREYITMFESVWEGTIQKSACHVNTKMGVINKLDALVRNEVIVNEIAYANFICPWEKQLRAHRPGPADIADAMDNPTSALMGATADMLLADLGVLFGTREMQHPPLHALHEHRQRAANLSSLVIVHGDGVSQ